MTKNLKFYFKEYKKELLASKEINYLIDAELYLSHRFLDSKVYEIGLGKNSIKIKFLSLEGGKKEVIEDRISFKGDKLYVDFNYKDYGGGISQVLLEEVEGFNVFNKDNLFYINLKLKNERERFYCYEKI